MTKVSPQSLRIWWQHISMGHNRDGCGSGGIQRMEWLILIEDIFVISQDKFGYAEETYIPKISMG